MTIWPKLHLIQRGEKVEVPTACYTLSPEDKHKLSLFLKNLKVPDGFSSNLSQYVNLKDHKICGLKMHDCHALLQYILPLALCVGESDKDSENVDYYGILTDVIELQFISDKRVILFRCNWFDVYGKVKGVKIDEYDFVSVNPRRFLKTNEPFVLANQASQVFYANDNSNKDDIGKGRQQELTNATMSSSHDKSVIHKKSMAPEKEYMQDKFESVDLNDNRDHIFGWMNELWNKWRGYLHATYVKNKPIVQALKNIPKGVEKKEWECKPIREIIYQQGEKDGNLANLVTIFFETRKKDTMLVEPEAIEKHAQIEEILKVEPSLPSIQIVEKCCGPQNRSHVFGFGGGVKAKDMRGGTSSKEELLSEIRSTQEKNKSLNEEN
ncbi:hypothetical protein MTR67_023111 [Solanum verrucosum]|uniref:DUF4216 domain-containing protein n=1 Tax=Solanum verrucosum TaxID=315347 RepID=A0AAF0R0A9_SOLVR|nr:hypothetical protein MTR67_023111 [Solanum verrucosum]